MKGVFLKGKHDGDLEETFVGQATETVAIEPFFDNRPSAIVFAMLTDIVSYSLEIVTVILIWRMTMGRIPINIPFVTKLLTAVFAIDIVFQSILFCSGIGSCPGSSKNNAENTGFTIWFPFRISASIGALCFIRKYSLSLKVIVEIMDTSTALFDLYFMKEQSLKISAGPLGWDLFSLLPMALIIASTCGFVCGCICICCPCFSYVLCCSKEKLQHQGAPQGTETQLGNEKIRSRPIYMPSRTLLLPSFLPTNIVGAGNGEKQLHGLRQSPDQEPSKLSLNDVLKSSWMRQAFDFNSLSFSIFVVALRFYYDTENVLFFHRVFWILPAYYYIITVVGFTFHFLALITAYFKPVFSFGCESFVPRDTLAWVKFCVMLLSAVWFNHIRESDPTRAIQVFFVALILEKVISLVRNLWLGLSKLYV